MYTPYMALIKSCFHNAKIIIDRFHIIQHLTRALNRTRIEVMNNNKQHQVKLKRYWKLLLKDYDKLDTNDYRYSLVLATK